MALKRPQNFNDIYGHKSLIDSIQLRIKENKFPNFTIFYGPEGVGKTTVMYNIAKMLTCTGETIRPCNTCKSCKEINERVFLKGLSSNNVATFEMAVDGGKEIAKSVLNYLGDTLTGEVRVVILDEMQGMSAAAQETLLHRLENLPKNIYVLGATTDITSLKKTFLSRAVKFQFNKLTRTEIKDLLSQNFVQQDLHFDNIDLATELIASAADYKPREALNIVQSFGTSRKVHLSELHTSVQFVDVGVFKELISCLEDSLVTGISIILDLDVTYQVQQQLIHYIVELLRYKSGLPVFVYDIKDISINVSVETLTKFLYYISSNKQLDTNSLLAAFLLSHINGMAVAQHDPDILHKELSLQQVTVPMLDENIDTVVVDPEDILRRSFINEDDLCESDIDIDPI